MTKPKAPSPPAEVTARAAAYECASGKAARLACEGLPFYGEHEGKPYCVLHYPARDKSATFYEALRRKLSAGDFNFNGVWFPDEGPFYHASFTKPASFNSAWFSAKADFRYARFSAGVDFGSAVFDGDADFNSATFREARFLSAKFGGRASFTHAEFGGKASFLQATFDAEADFRYARFGSGADFGFATFEDYARFAGNDATQVFGDESPLKLQFATVEQPDRVSFHTLCLRPQWFVNVDARRFEFINVDWGWDDINIRRVVRALRRANVSPPHRLLAIACRNLAVNAEECHRYEEASRFRYMAMEARRLERWGGFALWTLAWWYWLASGYGERVWRAFVMLLGVWALFALLYTRAGFVRWEPRVSNEREAAEARRDEVGQPLRGRRALTYSLGVMTLQKPEPRPATDGTQALVTLETILGPVQAALLALAIRRKFMR